MHNKKETSIIQTLNTSFNKNILKKFLSEASQLYKISFYKKKKWRMVLREQKKFQVESFLTIPIQLSSGEVFLYLIISNHAKKLKNSSA